MSPSGFLHVRFSETSVMEFLDMASNRWLCLQSVPLLAGLVVIAGCGRADIKVVPTPPPEVIVSYPLVRTVTEMDEYPGKIDAVATVDVRARVSGYITKINFTDGQTVKAGDILLEIDPRPYQADYDIDMAKIEQVKAQLHLAKIEVARYTELRRKGASTQEDLDIAISKRDQATADLKLSEASARQKKLSLDWTKVEAPIDGRVSRQYVNIGNLVNGVAGSATLLTTLVTVDPVYVYMDVDERSIQRYLRQAMERRNRPADVSNIADLEIPVSVALASEDGFPHRGFLDFVDNRTNPQTGTLKVRAKLPNPDRILVPGFFARAQIRSGEPYETILISERAIGSQQSLRYVLVVDDKNIVNVRTVEPGRMIDGLRVIHSGLTAKDRIIVEGLQRARPGEEVKPHEEPMPEPAGRKSAHPSQADTKAADDKSEPGSQPESKSATPSQPPPTTGKQSEKSADKNSGSPADDKADDKPTADKQADKSKKPSTKTGGDQ